MIKDFFKFAVISITHRKLRSWLTVLGIFIGIAAVVSLISISQGMQESIQKQFELLGTDNIIVMPGGGGMMGFGASASILTDDDVEAIKDTRGVEDAAAMLFKMASITYGSETKYTYVMGWPPDAKWVIDNMEIEGQVFEEDNTYKAVVGSFYPQARVFEKAVKIGNRIDIQDHTFKVVGVMQEVGNQQDDTQIFIPLETARDIFNEPEEIGMVYARVRTGYDASTVADAVEEDLRDSRNVDEGEEDFTVQTTAQLMETMQNILGIIQTILIGIAGISLLVGAVGIMNTMYTSVMERTKEIGIMKAIGAQNHDIWAIFLVESGLFGLIGGALGCALGLGMAKGVEIYAQYAGYGMLQASITWWLVALGLGLAFAIGSIAGLLPARAAAKMKPAQALRYE